MQPACADVFHLLVGGVGLLGDQLKRRFIERQIHLVDGQQRLILADQRVFGLRQYALVILHGERLQLDAHREATLQFRDQIGHFRDVERTRRDEQHMVSPDRPVLGLHGAALDDGQYVALHALAGHVGAMAGRLARHLVDFVDKDDAVLLGALDGLGIHRVHIDEVLFLLVDEDAARFLHLDLADLGFLGHDAAQHVVHVHIGAGDFVVGRDFLHLNLDQAMLQLAGSELRDHLAALFAQLRLLLDRQLGRARLVAQQHVDRIGRLFRRRLNNQIGQTHLGALARLDVDARLVDLLGQADGRFNQIADDRLHIAADIAHLGELGRLDLDERRIHQLGQTARDLGLAHAGGADHQDVFRRDLLLHLLGELRAAVAVPQRHSDGTLGVLLTDDIAVKLAHDFTGRQLIHASITSTRMWSLV